MKLGVNYLLEVKELFEEGKIDFIDYFKLYSINGELEGIDWCNEKRWLMFHGVIGKGSAVAEKDLIEKIDIPKTIEVINRSRTPHLSLHISIWNGEQTEEETYEAIKQNVDYLKKNIGKNIILENFPYRGARNKHEFLIRPEVISKIVYENDVGFLFDLSHARKAAEHFNMTLEEYVSKLPMDRVVEFHLAGMFDFPDISKEEIRNQYNKRQIEFINKQIEKYGMRFDNHGTLHEEDYSFLEEYLPKYKNTLKYITLEYGSYLNGDLDEDDAAIYPIASFKRSNPKIKEEVLEQLTRLKSIIDNI